MMIQIKSVFNEFKDCYYIKDNGEVINSNSANKLKPSLTGLVYLQTDNNEYKRISVKRLYETIYKMPYCIDTIEDLEDEVWKPIRETNDKYYISNKGRVKSYKGQTAKIIKPQINQKGYYRVELIYNDGQRKKEPISHLVAYYFLPIPAGHKLEVHHKNSNKGDNSASNLLILTPMEHRKIHEQIRKEQKERAINERSASEKDTN